MSEIILSNLTWLGIVFCITQSAIFSGCNLAFFSLGRMQLQVEHEQGNVAASKVLALREDSNLLLTTILWGNVSINVLLTLLSNSIMVGTSAFLFSTFIITFFGEILPQAYFCRNALKMATLFTPVLRFYQILLYPVARPCAKFLDAWLGVEGMEYLREKDLIALIRALIKAEDAEVQQVEGVGAINFLAIDDLFVSDEGTLLDAQSIITLPSKVDFPIIPPINRTPDDPFLKRIDASGQSWVVLANENQEPLLVVDANGLLRAALFDQTKPLDPYSHCHKPIIVSDPTARLGEQIYQLKTRDKHSESSDAVIENDVILLWHKKEKRIITGSDLLGRLLKGISQSKPNWND